MYVFLGTMVCSKSETRAIQRKWQGKEIRCLGVFCQAPCYKKGILEIMKDKLNHLSFESFLKKEGRYPEHS